MSKHCIKIKTSRRANPRSFNLLAEPVLSYRPVLVFLLKENNPCQSLATTCRGATSGAHITATTALCLVATVKTHRSLCGSYFWSSRG